jgi:hypothetical protein
MAVLLLPVDFQWKAAYVGLLKGCTSPVGRPVVWVDQPWLPSRSVTVSPFVEPGLALAKLTEFVVMR